MFFVYSNQSNLEGIYAFFFSITYSYNPPLQVVKWGIDQRKPLQNREKSSKALWGISPNQVGTPENNNANEKNTASKLTIRQRLCFQFVAQ